VTDAGDPTARAVELHERAIALRLGGDPLAAEVACREAVALFARHLGPQSPDLANALVEHARLLELLDRLDEGDRAVATALAILRPLCDPAAGAGKNGVDDGGVDAGDAADDLVRLTVQGELVHASLLRGRGDLATAEAVGRRALALAEARLPARDPVVGSVLNDLGVINKFLGNYVEAEIVYRRALDIIERPEDSGAGALAAGVDADALATLYHNLGGLAHARGDFDAGEPLARRALELREAERGADHIQSAADRAAWGALLEGQGRFAEAEAAYIQSLAVFESRLGPECLEAAAALASLGSVRHARGALAEAESAYRRALAIREAALGPAHGDLGLTLHNLAVLLDERGQTAEAAELGERARAMLAATLGEAHPWTRGATASVRAINAGRAR
jgi:tetratricopeptide (TPR) repeat protein